MRQIDKINFPFDLKKLHIKELEELAGEIREYIIKVISINGGHLAPSLGAVELAIAIHYVFNAPFDKIIWDVGHQAYPHKILTGRKEALNNIRKINGISGFPRISESEFDAFITGHSSTSISAGLGIASAKHLKKDTSKVVAVIGDGSMTGGIAYEGMNQAGHLNKDIIVILNDNKMSIAPNVGAISSLLSRKFSAKYIQNLKGHLENLVKSFPKIGDDIYKIIKRAESSLKGLLTPSMLFEAFNFEYYGPIDGHNLNHMLDILKNIKNLKKPILLHVITEKGKGYLHAEENPVKFHGLGAFDIETGEAISSSLKIIPTYTKIFGDTMVELAQKNNNIIAITAAMPEGTGLTGFSKIFPDRFFDVGIAEQHAVTFAAGMSTENYKPVVTIYSTFLQRAYDQIIHDVCIEALPVVFALDRGGIVGEDGPTHHGLFDLSYLRILPNMVIMAPKDENEFRRMLLTAISYNGPITIRYPRGKGVGVTLDEEIKPIQIGKGEIITEGDDVLILAIGKTVSDAIEAAELLKNMNQPILATVVNARFVKPLDRELILTLIKKTQFIVTIEENVLDGGFGSAVLEMLIDEGIYNFILKRIGIPDIFVEHGSQKELRDKYKINANGITEIIRNNLNEFRHKEK